MYIKDLVICAYDNLNTMLLEVPVIIGASERYAYWFQRVSPPEAFSLSRQLV